METEASIIEATTIDMLIERLQTHPEEFFKMNWDSPELASTDGVKWDLLMKNMVFKMSVFSREEIIRFSDALRKEMRKNVDVEIMKILIGDKSSDRFNQQARKQKEWSRQAAAQQAASQGLYYNTMSGSTMYGVNEAQQPNKPSLLQRLFDFS